jgi:hypothetical protein
MSERKDIFEEMYKISAQEDVITMDELNETDVGKCPICYETLKPMIYENDAFKANPNITTTPCGHTFCYRCLSKHLETKSKCPMCREKLCFKQKCRPISTYEGCILINQKVDYHLAHKINVINLAAQQLDDPNMLLSTIKFCMYDLLQTFRRLQTIDNDDEDEDEDL